jgi:hypothetical protein
MPRISPESFERLPLRGLTILEGVPLEDAWRVDLAGGGAGMTMVDFHDLVFGGGIELGAVSRSLFSLRMLIGRVFGWDHEAVGTPPGSFLSRLTDEDTEVSLVEPGTRGGIQRVLYVSTRESLSEIVNKTVHAFVLLAVEPAEGGYALYLGIFVRPINWFTPVYMAMIAPFRRWIIYPSLMRGLSRRWEERVRFH